MCTRINRFAVHLKPTQHCKSTALQQKKKKSLQTLHGKTEGLFDTALQRKKKMHDHSKSNSHFIT